MSISSNSEDLSSCDLSYNALGIEISFTTCTRGFYLEPSFEKRYTYYSYSSPEPLR